MLDRAIDERGLPEGLRLDNGPEFTRRYFVAWAAQRGIPLIYIQPGKPVQNSYIESFNGLRHCHGRYIAKAGDLLRGGKGVVAQLTSGEKIATDGTKDFITELVTLVHFLLFFLGGLPRPRPLQAALSQSVSLQRGH